MTGPGGALEERVGGEAGWVEASRRGCNYRDGDGRGAATSGRFGIHVLEALSPF